MSNTDHGIHPQVNCKLLSVEERLIIDKISSKYWFVTRIESIEKKKSKQTVAFLKPTDYITQNFNLSREVVLLMSSYATFEPRTLDLLDDIHKETRRLEEVCCIVASKDGDIEIKINNYMKSNKESRVIVPFSYDDLCCKETEFIVNQMRKFFYSRDLFGIHDPLKKELYFFGRQTLIQELVNKHANNENAGIFGLRKTGKTSIIYGVIRTLNRKSSHSLLIDCQTLHIFSWNIALREIIWNLIKGLSLRQKYFAERKDTYENENEAVASFNTDLKQVLQQSKKNILLIFDEIENITFDTSISPSWKSGESFLRFWQVIRSFCQHNRTKYHFSFLIAGTNPRCIETPAIHKVDNPIFAQFNPTFIEPFDFNNTKDMLSKLGGYMGINFTDNAVTAIADDFGGHPLLIRQMASYIHRNYKKDRPIEITKYEYEEYKNQFYEDETGFSIYAKMILQVLESWYDDEFYMLSLLAQDDISNFKELAEDDIYIKHLKNYGIIEQDNTSIGFHFKIEALKDYLLKKLKLHKLPITQEDKEALILKRRSNIEKKLRNLLRRQLKSNYGEDKAKRIMIKAIYGPKNIGHKENIKYADFFNPDKHDIFLKTLFDVISKHYEVFTNLFGVTKEIFDNKSSLMNVYRRTDAHSIPISDSDYQTFSGIASWFENILEDE